MSGDSVFVAVKPILGLGGNAVDGFTGATPLGQIATATGADFTITGVNGDPVSMWDAFLGLIPGSFGETSTLCILVGAVILVGHWHGELEGYGVGICRWPAHGVGGQYICH